MGGHITKGLAMHKSTTDSKITVCCPSGHRLRGDQKFLGKTVKCPKCQVQFVFAPTPSSHAKSSLRASVVDNRQITDTGVMRILGDMGELVSAAGDQQSVETRPCSRCGTAVPENLAVCSYCNCYVGVMPAYMQRLNANRSVEHN